MNSYYKQRYKQIANIIEQNKQELSSGEIAILILDFLSEKGKKQ